MAPAVALIGARYWLRLLGAASSVRFFLMSFVLICAYLDYLYVSASVAYGCVLAPAPASAPAPGASDRSRIGRKTPARS